MIPSLPRSLWLRAGTALYGCAFFVFLFVPLLVVAVFAFNDAPYPAPPWRGFTLDWFVGSNRTSGAAGARVGLLDDGPLLASVWTSIVVAAWVTLLSVLVGTANAFLLERTRFVGKQALSFLMLAPLVVPGVILGISILALARLTISARLRRFDLALEEAAYNLGASRAAVLWTITLPYLKPALVGAAAISFLMSFENFNTTLMLVGSDAPLTVMMYGRMREGASPVLNAVSLLLMLASAALALTLMRGDDGSTSSRRRSSATDPSNL